MARMLLYSSDMKSYHVLRRQESGLSLKTHRVSVKSITEHNMLTDYNPHNMQYSLNIMGDAKTSIH